MTCEVWFYHLERSGVADVLPELLEKTIAKGWRALVVSPDQARLRDLDQHLWTYKDDAFLGHGLEEEPLAERQPILLSIKLSNQNAADALFLLDGAQAEDLSPYQRCIVMFDGRDEGALAFERVRWAQLKSAGAPVSYWRQTDSGWEKKL